MNKKSDEILNILDSRERLKDGILPSGQLSRGVDVVGLLISGEMLLGSGVEFDHGFCQSFRMALQSWKSCEHRCVEGPIDLLQGLWAWEVHENQWCVPQKSL